MAEKDTTEKILEAYNDVFADIVNVLLFDGREVLKPEELVDQAPRAAYKADEKIREIERDVAKRWLKQNIRIACIGLENQTDIDPDMPLRVIGYDGAEYRAELSDKTRKERSRICVRYWIVLNTEEDRRACWKVCRKVDRKADRKAKMKFAI